MQWSPNLVRQNAEPYFENLCVFEIDEKDFISTESVYLTKQGWSEPKTYKEPDRDCEYTWGYWAARREFLGRHQRQSALALLTIIRGQGAARATSAALTEVIGGIMGLGEAAQFVELNALLRGIGINETAPEFLVGVPRITYKWRSRMRYWEPFTASAIEQLRRRGGFDLEALFRGISAVNG